MIDRLVSVAVLRDLRLLAWLVFQSQALWEAHGPCPALAVSFSRAGMVAISLWQDRRTGYLATRHALDLCEACAWEPEASQARYIFSLLVHWFEPLERRFNEAERAREGLLAAGDLRNASFSHQQSANSAFECGRSLRRYAEDMEAAHALARRAGNQQAIARCLADRQVIRALLGDAYPAAQPEAPTAPVPNWLAWYDSATRAITCAILGDGAGLSRHACAAIDRGRLSQVYYPVVWVYWLSGLARAWELQGSNGAAAADGDALAELDACIEWMRQRAIDAPFNFRHLHLHLLAERAWAVADWATAARRFDEAIAAAEDTSRPWHQALIVERAARAHLAQGWPYSGASLLREAQQLYASWGAVAKATQLGRQTGVPAEQASAVAASAQRQPAANGVDTAAVLRASRALSGERSTARLVARLREVLCQMTGATQVTLAMRDPTSGQWAERGAADVAAPLSSAVAEGPACLPHAVILHVERSGEPLLLADALSDDRFARDPYFRGVSCCALVAVPILLRGELCAVLLLEQRAAPGGFGPATLDAVMMVSGMVGVSLENALLYERLEHEVDEQTRQLRQAQALLVEEARRAGMAQIAVNVLHHVGNLLNNVNVSAHVMTERVRQSRTARISDLAGLLDHESPRRAALFERDGKGAMLPGYVRELAVALASEREDLLAELVRLGGSVAHIRNVVAMQQSYAGGGHLRAEGDDGGLDDALGALHDSLQREGVHAAHDAQGR